MTDDKAERLLEDMASPIPNRPPPGGWTEQALREQTVCMIEQQTANRRLVYICVALFLVAAYLVALLFRHEIVPTTHRESAYLLNRWTGEVQLLDGDTLLPVKRERR